MSSDPGEALRNAASRLVGFASLLVNETSLFAQHYNAAPIEERERFKSEDGTTPVLAFMSDLFSTVTKFLGSGMPGLVGSSADGAPQAVPTPPASLSAPDVDEDLEAAARVVSDFLNFIDSSLVVALRDAAGVRKKLIGHPDLDAKYVRALEFIAAVEAAARRYLGREEAEN